MSKTRIELSRQKTLFRFFPSSIARNLNKCQQNIKFIIDINCLNITIEADKD